MKTSTRFTASYAQDAQLGGHLDLSRRFGEERRFGMRLNGSVQQGDTVIDDQDREVGVGALSLDYQGDRLRTSLDLVSQEERFDAASRPFLIASGVQIPFCRQRPDQRQPGLGLVQHPRQVGPAQR